MLGDPEAVAVAEILVAAVLDLASPAIPPHLRDAPRQRAAIGRQAAFDAHHNGPAPAIAKPAFPPAATIGIPALMDPAPVALAWFEPEALRHLPFRPLPLGYLASRLLCLLFRRLLRCRLRLR